MKPSPVELVAARHAQSRANWLAANRTPHGVEPTDFTTIRRHTAVMTYFDQNPLEVPREGTTWRDYLGPAARHGALTACALLADLAEDGNPPAIQTTAELAMELTRLANELATNENTARELRKVAKTKWQWPVLRSLAKGCSQEPKPLLEALEVGRSAWPFSRPCPQGADTVRAFAQKILGRIESYRSSPFQRLHASKAPLPWQVAANDLEGFASDTWEAWFEAAWKMVLHDHGPKPEKDPILRQWGEYRKHHSATESPKTVASDVRDGIRERLKQAVKQMAFPKSI